MLSATNGGSSGASQAAGRTGGEATHVLTPSETATKNHTHTIPAHSHGLNNHTHSIPALSGTAASAGAHEHNVVFRDNAGTVKALGGNGGSQGTSLRPTYLSGDIRQQEIFAASAGSHTHSVTTNASTTGGASGNTANSAQLTSGGQTEANGTAHNNMPPYLSVYVWKRIA